MEIESPQSNAGERVEWFPSPLPGQVNHAGPMETSVAMKKTALLFALLLAVPGLTAAQSQTKSNDSTAVRQRVVGTTRAANHAEKRNGNVIHKLNPANLDRAEIGALVKEYGGEQMYSRWPEFEAEMHRGMGSALPENLDDFAACNITKKEDIYNLFVPNFFFGCESDDPTLNYAFASKVNPFGAKLGAILSSDISHFDVPDMTEVLEEAWELVEEKGMSEEDFQAFTFGNAVKLWASVNPDFFKGTVVESQVQKLQAQLGTA